MQAFYMPCCERGDKQRSRHIHKSAHTHITSISLGLCYDFDHHVCVYSIRFATAAETRRATSTTGMQAYNITNGIARGTHGKCDGAPWSLLDEDASGYVLSEALDLSWTHSDIGTDIRRRW